MDGGRGRVSDTTDQTIVYVEVRANNPCLNGKDNQQRLPHLSSAKAATGPTLRSECGFAKLKATIRKIAACTLKGAAYSIKSLCKVKSGFGKGSLGRGFSEHGPVGSRPIAK